MSSLQVIEGWILPVSATLFSLSNCPDSRKEQANLNGYNRNNYQASTNQFQIFFGKLLVFRVYLVADFLGSLTEFFNAEDIALGGRQDLNCISIARLNS